MSVSFDKITLGSRYTRPELAELWGYSGYEAISRGAVTPSGTPYIILFITKEKQEFLTQYEDVFSDGILEIEGETSHTADRRIVKAEANGDEIHLFYRKRHHMPFTYEGRIYLSDYKLLSDKPSRFRFAVGLSTAQADSSLATEEATHGIIDPEFIPDEEGRRIVRQHVSYERSRRNRAKAIQIHGTSCKACGFNFDKVYGQEYAKSYIEIHHVKSITWQEGRSRPVDPATDLITLCSNCHSMAHRKKEKNISHIDLKKLLEKTE